MAMSEKKSRQSHAGPPSFSCRSVDTSWKNARSPILLLLLLALGLGGCECGASAPQPSTTIAFWHTFNAEETKTVETLVRQFESEHPGVRVEVTVLPFGAARNRLRTSLRTDNGPDLARAEIAWVPELASERLIVPLDTHVNLAEHIPAARSVVSFEGQTWGFPQGVDCLVLYYNRTHLRQIGAQPPTTVDALIDTGQKLTRDKAGRHRGEAGYDPDSIVRHAMFIKGDGYYFLPFFWAFGGETFVGDAHEVRVDSRASVKAARQFAELVRVFDLAPRRVDFARDYAEELSAFGQGRVSMIVQGPWAAAEILRGPAFEDGANLGVAPVPRGMDGGGGSPSGGHAFVVSARSARNPLAVQLGAFLASADSQKLLALDNHILPTRIAVYDDPSVRSAPLLLEFRAALDESHPRALFPGMAQMFDALTPAVQRLLRGESDAETLLGAVAKEWKEITP